MAASGNKKADLNTCLKSVDTQGSLVLARKYHYYLTGKIIRMCRCQRHSYVRQRSMPVKKQLPGTRIPLNGNVAAVHVVSAIFACWAKLYARERAC